MTLTFLLAWTFLSAAMWSQVAGINSLLKTEGNTTIVVILDVHRHHGNNGLCTGPDWETLQLAYSIWYNHNNSHSDIGIEIYDGCGSIETTLAVLRHRLFQTNSTSKVVGVLAFGSPEVRKAVSVAVQMSDVFLVMLGDTIDETEREQHRNVVTVDLDNNSTVEVLKTLVHTLNWTYITTLSDGKRESARQHRAFLSSLDDMTCVQESYQDVTASTPNFDQIQSSGVILFSSDNEITDTVIQSLPIMTAVILVSNGKQVFDFKRNVIVLNEIYDIMGDFSNFMSHEILDSVPSNLLADYYITKFNCSTNVTKDKLSCSDTDNIRREISLASSSRLFNMASTVVRLMSSTISTAISTDCSASEVLACVNTSRINDMLINIDTGFMAQSSMYNLSLSLFVEGTEQLSQSIHHMDLTLARQHVEGFVTSLDNRFPASKCNGWCPTCKQDGCGMEPQSRYNGDYLFIPGDIVIAAMIPFTKYLVPGKDGMCSGYSITGNTDIMAEAFLYAIRTAQLRYPYLLGNMSVGVIVFDSCSDHSRVTQVLMNFESCLYDFDILNGRLVPYIVPAYINYVDTNMQNEKQSNILKKPQISVVENGKIYNKQSLLFDNALFNHDAVVSVLRRMDWKYVGLITSQSARNDINMAAFHDLTMANGICILYDLDITEGSEEGDNSLATIRQSTIGVFIIFADHNDVDRFFRNFISRPITKTWIIIETRKNWLDFGTVILPSGTMILQRSCRTNSEFNSYLQDASMNRQLATKFWSGGFQDERDECVGCDLPDPVADIETRLRASDIIKATDVVLHAVDIAYDSSCVNVTGPCRELYTQGFSNVSNNINRVIFNYDGETVDLRAGFEIIENYDILNIQASRIVEIGSWTNGRLNLEKTKYKAYDSSGDEINDNRRFNCYGRCVCLNIRNTSSPSNVQFYTEGVIDSEKGFTDSTGKFTNSLWSIVVVIIASSGAFATLCLMLYIMCKVCAGAIVRRYLALGLMLLVGMIFLFMSVLPFVFTPSEAVCGSRYFVHGFSYALCYGIVLTKLTTLRDYRYIGLGGDVSRINQLFSVFFIVAVQVAIGVQWWVLRTPVVFTTTNSTLGSDSEETLYACDFTRGDYLAYHSYVIFLIIVCCLYSISVRNESKNMKEARLLLISSWVCLAVWIALIVTIIVMERSYIEPICSIGLLANALTMMVVIYFPKLTAISRLRYEVSDQSGRKDSKADTEFQFERPYSLPGTLHSAVTEKSLSLSYQRSLAAFDSSLSY